jgi:hypothetical protein
VVPRTGVATQVCCAVVNIPAHYGLNEMNAKIQFGDIMLHIIHADVGLEETTLFFETPTYSGPPGLSVPVSVVSELMMHPSQCTFTYLPHPPVKIESNSQLPSALIGQVLVEFHAATQRFVIECRGGKDLVRAIQGLEKFYAPRMEEWASQLQPGLLQTLRNPEAEGGGSKPLDLTALHVVSAFGWADVANSMLAKNIEINQMDRLGNTARDWAYMHDQYIVLQTLISRGGIANSSATVLTKASG